MGGRGSGAREVEGSRKRSRQAESWAHRVSPSTVPVLPGPPQQGPCCKVGISQQPLPRGSSGLLDPSQLPSLQLQPLQPEPPEPAGTAATPVLPPAVLPVPSCFPQHRSPKGPGCGLVWSLLPYHPLQILSLCSQGKGKNKKRVAQAG